MPVCPRCGKSLCSEQALMYHLNRKYRCGSWKCEKCNIDFDTKFNLSLHKIKCDSVQEQVSSETLLNVLNKIPLNLFVLEKENITFMNSTASKHYNMNSDISEIAQQNVIYHDDTLLLSKTT